MSQAVKDRCVPKTTLYDLVSDEVTHSTKNGLIIPNKGGGTWHISQYCAKVA